jgi:nucleoside-diphosphate-sugar epimerase
MASAHGLAALLRRMPGARLLFVSAAGVMGVGEEPKERNEESFGACDPTYASFLETDYLQSKMEVEEYFRREGLSPTVFYPSTVYGPGMPAATLGALRKRIAVVPPGGTSFLSLADFLSAMDLAQEAAPAGERYLLNGANLRYAELFREAAVPLRLPLPGLARPALRWVGRRAALHSTAVLESAFGFKFYSAKKFGRQFSWRPESDFRRVVSEI